MTWLVAAAAAGILSATGAGWWYWMRAPAGPDEEYLRGRLAAELPAYVQVSPLRIQSSARMDADPVEFRTTFQATLVAAADTFTQSSVEDGVLILAPMLKEGTRREIGGVAVSVLSDGMWNTDFSFETDPAANLGSPRGFFQGSRVVVQGSPDEAAFREEQRRLQEDAGRIVEAQRAEERAQELARQQQVENARRELERVRVEAETAVRLARTQEEALDARRRQAEIELAARAAAAVEESARATAESNARRQAKDASGLVEIPRGAEVDVRLSTSLNSGAVSVEDRFEATTVNDLIVLGRVAIPAGSVMRGVVTGVSPATRTNRTARMSVTFDQVTVNGRGYPIRGTVTRVIAGEGLKGEATRVGTGAAVGAILGGLFGGVKGAIAGLLIGGGGTIAATDGKEVELPEGSVVRVRLESPPQVR